MLKSINKPDLTSDRNSVCETHKENPVAGSHESSLYFRHQKTEQELFFCVVSKSTVLPHMKLLTSPAPLPLDSTLR